MEDLDEEEERPEVEVDDEEEEEEDMLRRRDFLLFFSPLPLPPRSLSCRLLCFRRFFLCDDLRVKLKR